MDMTNPIRSRSLLAIALAVIASCHSEPSKAPMQPTTTTPPASITPTTGHADIEGVNYYYEIHGQGAPLLMLHGGLMSSASFHPLVPSFAGRQVILVDLQGHGRTTLGDRPITLETNAKHLDALLDKIGVPQVDVVGYSFGGGTGLRLAMDYPQRVKKLVVVSAPFAQNGWYAEMLPQQAAVSAQMLPMMKDSPMYQQYLAVAPKPDDYGRLLDRMGEWMRAPYDYSTDVAKVTAQTMLVYGDADMVRIDHTAEFYKLLGGAQKDAGWQREHMAKNRLAIIPDATHYDIFYSPLLVPTLRHFLDNATGPKTTDQVSAR
jgi:pimeloyl-ACP methyl ester carboxylesterase